MRWKNYSNDWPTVDRINPTKGYTKTNIQVISNRANTLKNNASAYELRMIADFLEKVNYEDKEIIK